MADQNNQLTQDRGAGKSPMPMGDAGFEEGRTGNGIDKAKDVATTLMDQARSAAGTAYEAVADKANSTIEEKKAGLTGGLTSVADTIRQVGDGLNRGDDQNPVAEYSAQYAETAAAKLEQVAGYFENKDLRAMARDLESFARRNPAVFLGSAFALGVLAARFFKSSAPTLNIETGALPEAPQSAGAAGGAM